MIEFTKLQTKINRLNAQKSALTHKLKLLSQGKHKARTRTLIQIGGLVNMLGLLDYCDIQLGEDLQSDLTAQDKAAILLGLFVALQEQLPPQLTITQINQFKRKGVRMMKMHATKKY